MEKAASISVETRLERDGVLTLTGLPFRAGERLVVQIDSVAAGGGRRFPMRDRPYTYSDPFEPAGPPDGCPAVITIDPGRRSRVAF